MNFSVRMLAWVLVGLAPATVVIDQAVACGGRGGGGGGGGYGRGQSGGGYPNFAYQQPASYAAIPPNYFRSVPPNFVGPAPLTLGQAAPAPVQAAPAQPLPQQLGAQAAVPQQQPQQQLGAPGVFAGTQGAANVTAQGSVNTQTSAPPPNQAQPASPQNRVTPPNAAPPSDAQPANRAAPATDDGSALNALLRLGVSSKTNGTAAGSSASVAGEFVANLSNGAVVKLNLNGDGTFAWQSTKDGRSNSFQGRFTLEDGALKLLRNDNQKLEGSFATTSSGFTFRLAGQEETSLSFVRG